ncbi:MAG: hypothetical protein ACOYBJ_02280 [Patescibacteria group bacterium]|jgi:hypothetical protein
MKTVRPIQCSPVGIICLYGESSLRTTIESTGYDEYLQGCAEQIIREGIRTVVLCGGKQIHSACSDTRSVCPALCQHLTRAAKTSLDTYRIEFDESSVNMPQSIAHGLRWVQMYEPWRREIHVFVDNVRWFPGWVLTRNICSGYRTRVHSIPHPNAYSSSTRRVQILRGLHYLIFPQAIELELDAPTG